MPEDTDIHIEFNKNNDISQFEKDNSHISLFITDINGEALCVL